MFYYMQYQARINIKNLISIPTEKYFLYGIDFIVYCSFYFVKLKKFKFLSSNIGLELEPEPELAPPHCLKMFTLRFVTVIASL